jgi:hypothetical protein
VSDGRSRRGEGRVFHNGFPPLSSVSWRASWQITQRRQWRLTSLAGPWQCIVERRAKLINVYHLTRLDLFSTSPFYTLPSLKHPLSHLSPNSRLPLLFLFFYNLKHPSSPCPPPSLALTRTLARTLLCCALTRHHSGYSFSFHPSPSVTWPISLLLPPSSIWYHSLSRPRQRPSRPTITFARQPWNTLRVDRDCTVFYYNLPSFDQYTSGQPSPVYQSLNPSGLCSCPHQQTK